LLPQLLSHLLPQLLSQCGSCCQVAVAVAVTLISSCCRRLCRWRLSLRSQIKLLVENSAHAALLHAFDGKPTYALQGAQAGYYFSVPPSIVRSPQKQKVSSALG
jgi:Tat protein secretion system quality control protein TatD with DNase activity